MSLKYQKTNAGWGLAALFEGNTLNFSGGFGRQDLKQQKIKKFFSFKKPRPAKKTQQTASSIDLYELFSDSAKKAWENACLSAQKRKAKVGVEDIFLALLEKDSVKNLLIRLKVSASSAEILIKNYLSLTHASSEATVKVIPFEAFLIAVKLHNHKIGTFMLLGALLKATPQDNILQAIFSNIGLTLEKLELFTVWKLELNYEFPKNSSQAKLLYCCQQSEILEQHLGYLFELPAIETAVALSANQTLKDLEHKKALQLLVKAAALAKNKGSKMVSENLVSEAAGR